MKVTSIPVEPEVVITLTHDEASRLAVVIYGKGSEEIAFADLFYALPSSCRAAAHSATDEEVDHARTGN